MCNLSSEAVDIYFMVPSQIFEAFGMPTKTSVVVVVVVGVVVAADGEWLILADFVKR